MKILIVGSDLNAKLLALYLKLEDSNNDIYLTTEEKCSDNSFVSINIKENDIGSICDFVKYNQIEFTIVTSSMAMINGIADEFKKECFPIFAPSSEAERITYFNSIAKKIMYKLKINTPKFGIFDRENLAIEYIRKAKFPIVVENDFTLLSRENYIFKTFSQAKPEIRKIFENGNDKIVIENYIDEIPIYLYFITDGYNAMPLISLTRISGENYTTVSAPAINLSDDTIIEILKNVIYPLLDDITKYADKYIGILGLKLKIHKNTFYILEFYNNFQHYDFQAFISLLDDNLLNLLYDTSSQGLTDNRDYINLSDKYSYTTAINKSQINNLEIETEDDFIISEDKDKYIFTYTASTINKAKDTLHDYLNTIINNQTYNSILQANQEKELRI